MSSTLLRLIIFVAAIACVPGYGWDAASGPLGSNPQFTHIPMSSTDSIGEVLSIAQDKKGFLWFAGRGGLVRYDGYRFHTYKPNPNDPFALGASYLTHVFEDSFGELWVATYGAGVARLNRQLDNFYIYKYKNEKMGEINNQRFDQIYEDEQKNLWIVGTGGVALYDRLNDKFDRYLKDSSVINELFFAMVQLDVNEYLFLAPSGVYFWNRRTDYVEKIVPDAKNPKAHPFATTRGMIKDKNGNIWLGHEKGLCKFIPSTKTFEIIPLNNKESEVAAVSVLRITEDKSGMLWVATDGNGLMYFDPITNAFGNYTKSPLPSSLNSPVVRSVFEDKVGDLWVGTFPAALNHYDRSNSYFSYYSNFMRNKSDVFSNNVWSFSEDERNDLWLGVDKLGLVYFDRKSNTFAQHYDGFDFSKKGFPHSVLSTLIYRSLKNGRAV